VTLVDSRVSSNYSGTSGGGIWTFLTDLTVSDSAVTANGSFDYSPGIMFHGAGVSSMAITNTTISGNTAAGPVAYSGGAITCHEGALSLYSSLVSDNAALSGVELGLSSTALIVNAIVRRNAGSGISVGCVGFAGADDSTLILVNSTITSNPGAGLRVGDNSSYYPSAQIANSILWGNSSPLVVGQYASATVGHSLVEGGWPGTGNIDVDPLFADALNGDLRLLSGSPCIDAGDNLAVPPTLLLDLDGKNRFLDDLLAPDTGNPGMMLPIIDMGAYEGPLFPGRRVRRR
jgi:hypothetical protein